VVIFLFRDHHLHFVIVAVAGGCNGQEQVIIDKKKWHIREDKESLGHQRSKKRFIAHQNMTTTMITSTKIVIITMTHCLQHLLHPHLWLLRLLGHLLLIVNHPFLLHMLVALSLRDLRSTLSLFSIKNLFTSPVSVTFRICFLCQK
jgi:hypothetical protein